MPISAATQILEQVWEPRGFPVDPAWIAGQFGIQIYEATFEKEISGALIKKPGEDPLVMLSIRDSKPRQRFTCAHELGHYIQRHQRADLSELYDYVDFRDTRANANLGSNETYANDFAAHLLMPPAEINLLWREDLSDYAMAIHFGVPLEAVRDRLKQLGHV